jgi:RimJ/RimL family protein N-acetyltransferase
MTDAASPTDEARRARFLPADPVLVTERVALRQATASDAEFVLRLMNEPAWRKYIREHEVRSSEAARQYIEERIAPMYREHGVGLWVMERKPDAEPIGVCGLLKRPSLSDFDLGYALLSEHWGRGYAAEAAAGVVRFAAEQRRLPRLLAMTHPDNARSVRVLERLGFGYVGLHEVQGEPAASLYELLLSQRG